MLMVPSTSRTISWNSLRWPWPWLLTLSMEVFMAIVHEISCMLSSIQGYTISLLEHVYNVIQLPSSNPNTQVKHAWNMSHYFNPLMSNRPCNFLIVRIITYMIG